MRSADICLILEDNYPFSGSGISRRVHQSILAHPSRTFHLLTVASNDQNLRACFTLPDNVVGHSHVTLGELPHGARKPKGAQGLQEKLQRPLSQMLAKGGLQDLRQIIQALAPLRGQLGSQFLLNSQATWKMLRDMYEQSMPNSSFIDYFWSWRHLVSSIFSMLLCDLPEAGVYHSYSSGYAGLLLARASIESNRPSLLSEYGTQLCERRIELAMANWLCAVKTEKKLAQQSISHQLRELWLDTFSSFSNACHQAACEIIAPYQEPQNIPAPDEPVERVRLIPNGVDVELFCPSATNKDDVPLTIALIGRVVPQKDVITFIRASEMLTSLMPAIRIWILGSLDEEPEYASQCRSLVERLGLGKNISFLGEVDVRAHLPLIHLVVLTSISETQPQALLEAGAAGIPCVATDVGACREMIIGSFRENPPLGPAGEITALASPDATANAIYHLFEDPSWYERCATIMRRRIQLYYNKKVLERVYSALYAHYLSLPDSSEGVGGFQRWPG